MKKTLISALTTALVVGAASTTFAAANPFEDVPADHWAYDAIAQLAADGVIEGYGDGTYRGDQEITRYEMAQMIARAMAKGGGDKALIDKLAAEFADELNNLGVRVAALEKKVDNVKWGGEIRFNFRNKSTEKTADHGNTQQYYQLRLKPSMTINKNWTGRAQLFYGGINGATRKNFNTAENLNGDHFHVKVINVEGVYGNTMIELGKPYYTTAVDEGMIYDGYNMTGGTLTFGKDLKFRIAAGRMQTLGTAGQTNNAGDTVPSTYVGGELTYNKNNFFAGLGYHYLANKEAWNRTYGDDSANIWVLGLGYKFGDFRLFGTYAQNTQGGSTNSLDENVPNSSAQRKAYNIRLSYKGAKASKPGTWGLEAGYIHLGQFASLSPIYDYQDADMKGWSVGSTVTLFKNIRWYLGYSDGKTISDDKKTKILWTRVRFDF